MNEVVRDLKAKTVHLTVQLEFRKKMVQQCKEDGAAAAAEVVQLQKTLLQYLAAIRKLS